MNISQIFLKDRKIPTHRRRSRNSLDLPGIHFHQKLDIKKKIQMHDAWFNSKSKRTPSKVALWRPLSQGLLDHIINKLA